MDFNSFLTNLLKEKKIDVGVYHSYLVGILEDTIDEDEKREMVLDIVSSLIVSFSHFSPVNFPWRSRFSVQEADAESVVSRIFDKWNETHDAPKKTVELKQEEVDIAELLKTTTKISLESSSKSTHRQLTDEEKRIKQQILANYSQTSDKEEDDEEQSDDEPDDPDLEKNTNKADVAKLAREKREQAKKESEEKKLKDKEDRAKQKALREEKKSKRQGAAVKGERRRWCS